MVSPEKTPPQIPVTEEMRAEIRDALAEVDPAQMASLARLTPAERMKRGFGLIDAIRRLAVGRLRQIHPELDEAEANRQVLARYYALEDRYTARR